MFSKLIISAYSTKKTSYVELKLNDFQVRSLGKKRNFPLWLIAKCFYKLIKKIACNEQANISELTTKEAIAMKRYKDNQYPNRNQQPITLEKVKKMGGGK